MRVSPTRQAVLLGGGLAAVALLCWEVGIPVSARALASAQPGGLLFYGGSSVLVILGYSLRWYLVSRSLGADLQPARFVLARIGGDAVGSLMPGMRLAGDPVRAALLRRAGIAATPAAASVAIDRVLELVGSTVCASVYVTIFSLATAGRSRRGGDALLPLMFVFLLVLLIATMVLLSKGKGPFQSLYGSRSNPVRRRWAHFFCETEEKMTEFFRRHPWQSVAGVLASVAIELLVVAQYRLLLSAFAIQIDFSTLLMVLVASGMARAVPTPGSLGALEAGQVTVLSFSGAGAEIGLAVALIIRLHQTLWIAIGFLVLAGQGVSLGRLRRVVTPGAVP